MPIDPDQYSVIDGSDVEPRQIRPQHPLTEWTGRAILEGIRAFSGGTSIPAWDSLDATDHYGSTNNIRNLIYKLSGAEVARFTFTYINGGAADDDDLATATLTIA